MIREWIGGAVFAVGMITFVFGDLVEAAIFLIKELAK